MADSNSYIAKANGIAKGVRSLAGVNVAGRSAKADKIMMTGAWSNYSKKAEILTGANNRPTTGFNLPTPEQPVVGRIAPTAAGTSETPDYSEWGAVGWAFRIATGLGRAVLNVGANSLHAAAQMNDIFKDGLQSDELGKLGGAAWSAIWAAPVGVLEGLTYSAVPDAKKDLEKAFGSPIYDRWDQVINNEDWIKAGIPKVSEEVYWDTALGGWTAKNTLGTALDIFTDPATYLTFGVGGAVKGAARGVATAARYAKAVDKAAAAAKPLLQPRPFYAGLAKEEGKVLRTRLGNQIPLDAPSYTIANTNPLLYVLKESARGFKEAHANAHAASTARIAARDFQKALEEKTAAKGEALLPEEVLQVGKDMTDEVNAARRAELEAKNVDQATVDRIIEQQSAEMAKIAEAAASPKGMKKLKGNMAKQALQRSQQALDEAGVPTYKGSPLEAADNAARAVEGPSPVFQIKKPAAEARSAKPIQAIADRLLTAIRTGKEDPYAVWKSEVEANPAAAAEFLKYADRHVGAPIGHKQTVSRNVKNDIQTTAKGTETRRKGGSGPAYRPHNNEQKFLQRRQSDLQAKNKAMVWSGDNLANDWQRLRTAMGLDSNANVTLNLSALTGEQLQKSGVSMSLFAARLEWAAMQASGRGVDDYALHSFGELGINPYTYKPEETRTWNIWATEADKQAAKALGGRDVSAIDRAAVFGLMNTAAGVIRNKEVRDILQRLGLQGRSLEAIKGRVNIEGIADALSAARIQKLLKAKKDIEKAISKKTIKIMVDGKPTVVTSDMVTAMDDPQVTQVLEAALRRNKYLHERVTDAELETATKYIEKLNADRYGAIQKLEDNGFDVYGDAKDVFAAVTGGYDKNLGDMLRKNLDTIFAHEKDGGSERIQAEFIAFAYRASQHKDSLDGGMFAEQLDKLVAEAGIPPLESFKTRKALFEALKPLTIDGNKAWTEYVTMPLLHSTIARTRTVGKATGAGLSARQLTIEEKRLQDKAVSLTNDLLNAIAANRQKLDGFETNKVTLEMQPGKQHDTSFFGHLSEGTNVTGKMMISDEFPAAQAAAQKKLDEVKLVRVDKESIAHYNKIENKEGLTLLKKDASGKLVQAANIEEATSIGMSGRFLKPTKAQYRALNTPERGLFNRFQAGRYESARKAGVEKIAKDQAMRSLPLELEPKALAEFIKREIRVDKNSIERVEANLEARFWLHSDLRIAENARDIRIGDSTMRKIVLDEVAGISDLSKKRGKFAKLVDKLEKAVTEGAGSVPKEEWNKKDSVEKVILGGNPYKFISWVKNKQVFTAADREEWSAAMEHMRNFTAMAGGDSPYTSYRDMLKSYVGVGGQRMIPGQINPKTGKPIPTEQQMLEVLDAMGVKGAAELLTAKQIADRTSVMKLIDGSKKLVNQEELAAARAATIFSENIFAASDLVEGITTHLPGPEDSINTVHQLLASAVNELVAQGRGGLVDIVVNGLGRTYGDWTTVAGKEYGVWEAAALHEGQKDFARPVANIIEQDSLNRGIRYQYTQKEWDQLKAAGKVTGNRRAYKLNFDKENLLTSWSYIVNHVKKSVDTDKIPVGSPLYHEVMHSNLKEALRLRDLMLQARGIFPSSNLAIMNTRELGRTVATLNKGFADLTKAEQEKIGKYSIYLTEADFMDALKPETFDNAFLMGSGQSLPITTLFAPTRFMLMVMDGLKPGEWFDAETLQKLSSVMQKMMNDEISRIIKKDVVDASKGHMTGLANAELTAMRAAEVVRNLLDENTALHLQQVHSINAGFAYRRHQYDAGVVTEDIFNKLVNMLDNPAASDGTNLQAVMQATEELNNVLGATPTQPIVDLLARLDLQTRLAARITDKDAVVINFSQQVKKAGEEAKNIQALQEGLANAHLNAQTSMDPILNQPLMEMETMKVVTDFGGDPDLIFEVGMNQIANRAQLNGLAKTAHAVDAVGALFSDYGMENTRYLADAVMLRSKDTTSLFKEAVSRQFVKTKLRFQEFEQQTGRRLDAEAFAVLQKMPDEVAVKGVGAMRELENIAKAKAQGTFQGITKKKYAQLLEDAGLLDEFVSAEDTYLRGAISDIWEIHNKLFSGEENSLVARIIGMDARHGNSAIRELGVGQFRGNLVAIDNTTKKIIEDPNQAAAAVKAGTATWDKSKTRDAFAFRNATDPKDFANVWREWDIQNPYDMYIGAFSATTKVNEIREFGSSLAYDLGIHVDDVTPEMAKQADLVKLKVTGFGPGNELLHAIPKDYYFPRDVAVELSKLSKFMTDVKHLQANGTLEKALLSIQGIQDFAKKAMTQYSLKNWVQNTIGGYFANGMLNGTWSILAYARAIKIMKAMGKDIEAMGFDEGSIEAALAKIDQRSGMGGVKINPKNDPRTAAGYTVRIQNKEVFLTHKELWDLYVKTAGVIPHSQSGGSDLIREILQPGQIKQPNRRQLFDTRLAKLAGDRDDMLRFAGFLDSLMKGNWNDLNSATKSIAKRINKIHPQLQGLSGFNQKWTRSMILFFTWRAKMLGAVLTGIADKPGPALTVLRAQQFLAEAQGAEYSGFGDTDPNNMLIPSYKKGNLNPTFLNAQGRMESFTLSNPVTDLLGTGGWLQAIRFNNKDSAGQQVAQITAESFNNFVDSSKPLLLSIVKDWAWNQKTAGGDPLMSGQRFTNKTMPLLVEDSLNKLGLGAEWTAMALLFPDMAKKASQDGMSKNKAQADNWRVVFNWLTGVKATELDTIELRQKAVQEILARRKDQAGL